MGDALIIHLSDTVKSVWYYTQYTKPRKLLKNDYGPSGVVIGLLKNVKWGTEASR
jgi:hypothetical protein